jgi:hypothetical protein
MLFDRLIRIIFIFLAATLFHAGTAMAQTREVRNALFVEPKFRVGPVLDIYPNLPEHGIAWSMEVNVGWQTAGRQYWNQGLRFPQVGIIAAITELGNPDIMGREYSLVPNLAYRFVQSGIFELRGFIGIGFSWFNKPYDRISNPENLFIGSRLTNKTILGLNADFSLTSRLSLSSGMAYLHYSNGHNQLPNVGVNIPAIHLGARYYIRGAPEKFVVNDTMEKYSKRWLLNIRLGLGVHEFGDPAKPVGGPKYPIYNGSVYLSKRLGAIINLHAGLHLNYYTSFYDYLAFHGLHEQDRHMKSLTVIGFGGLEFLLGHFAFTTQMGFYLYNPTYREIQSTGEESNKFKENAKNYLSYKFGAQYYLFQTRYSTRFNPWIGLFLKSNAGQADFAEISIGCAF